MCTQRRSDAVARSSRLEFGDEDGPRVQSIMDRSSLNMAGRATAYRKAGWNRFDPAAGRRPHRLEQIRRERDLYR